MKTNQKMAALAAIIIAVASCNAPRKVTYEFPGAMKESVRVQFLELAQKGKILYDINCAACHNKKQNGHEVIPDFPLDKLTGYELRVKNNQHETAMPDTKVTAEELGTISTFLTYKKKVGVPMSVSATAMKAVPSAN